MIDRYIEASLGDFINPDPKVRDASAEESRNDRSMALMRPRRSERQKFFSTGYDFLRQPTLDRMLGLTVNPQPVLPDSAGETNPKRVSD